jgi:hypothetical protein
VVQKLLISYKTKEASQLEAQTQRSKKQLAASFALPNKMHKDQLVPMILSHPTNRDLS